MPEVIDVAKSLLEIAQKTGAGYSAAKLTPDGSKFPKDWRIRVQVFKEGSEWDE